MTGADKIKSLLYSFEEPKGSKITLDKLSTTGFIGVYIAGYILELTGSWSAVFNITALINFVGITTFVIFGSGNPIV